MLVSLWITPLDYSLPVLKYLLTKVTRNYVARLIALKAQARSKSLPAEDLKDATIMLSNFGTIAGRYANPIIVPPMVAIIGIGRSAR